MITRIKSLKGTEETVSFTLVDGGTNYTMTLPPFAQVDMVCYSVTVSSTDYEPLETAPQCLFIAAPAPFLRELERPGTVNGVALGVWVIVILIILFKSQITP